MSFCGERSMPIVRMRGVTVPENPAVVVGACGATVVVAVGSAMGEDPSLCGGKILRNTD